MAKKKKGSLKLTDSVLITSTDLTTDVTGVLATANGGTGTGAPNTGDLLHGTAGNVWSRLAIGSAQQELRVNSGGTDTEWWSNSILTRLTADNSAIAAAAPTTVVAVAGLQQAANINDEWDIEWILHIANSVATDVFAFNVSSSAGTFTGRYTVTGANGVPGTGAGVVKFLQQPCGTITVASANAPGNTGTIGLITTVIIRAQGKLTVAAGSIQVLLRAGTSAAASSGTATVKLQSQMIARRIA